jgi:hypothetical protein
VDLTEAPDRYCRELEAYLCRKNDGHLVRIVGPAFDTVSGWARRGVPLAVARTGIDRYVERYYAKGPRRRPVRIEFCEADVLDAFEEWRRAVGVPAEPAPGVGSGSGAAADADAGEPLRRHASLSSHLETAIARLTALRAGPEGDRALDDVIAALVRELDGGRAAAKRLRGDARQRLLDRLREMDAELLRACRDRCAPAVLAELETEADRELSPFRSRMGGDAYAAARAAAADRVLRRRRGLPTLAFD